MEPIENPKNGHRHKSKEAMNRCLGCSDPKLLSFDEHDLKVAKMWIKKGYKSKSTKHRILIGPNKDEITLDLSTFRAFKKLNGQLYMGEYESRPS